MRDLFDKIQQLRKALSIMKPKQDSFVPALKLPSLDTLRMPSISSTGGAPTKIPGVEPPTGKDPKKVAEQLKNPRPKKPSTAMIKIASNGQWSLSKAAPDKTLTVAPSTVASLPSRTVKPQEAFGYGHHSPEQDKLVHGIDFATARPAAMGAMGAQWMKSAQHPHTVIVKNAMQHADREARGHNELNSAKREVLFHNMARDYFGLGQHVPLTAGFTKNGQDFSVQKRVPDAEHLSLMDPGPGQPLRVQNPVHEKTLRQLHGSGDLHKLAIMDNIMGNHDRHRGNYMLDNKGGLHLIDNGASFDYKNFDPYHVSQFHNFAKQKGPVGLNMDDTKLHPEAEKWLMNLDPKKAAELFASHSYPQSSEHVKGFMTRLAALKDAVKNKKYKDVTDLLTQNRLSSGPMMEHKDNKAASLDALRRQHG